MNFYNKIRNAGWILLLFLALAPSVALAVDQPSIPSPEQGLAEYLKGIYEWVSYLTIGAATIAFIMAAFTYMKGGKDSISKARKYAESAVIAMIIVASAYLFFTILSPDIFLPSATTQ